MIKFNDKKLFLKGTCNVICEDISTNDVVYQSNKMVTGNIQTSVTLTEIRAGYGNTIATIIPTDSDVKVDFDAADFNIWAKAAQVGSEVTFSAPVPKCQTVIAQNEILAIDTSEGIPVAQIGAENPYAFVQTVGEASLIAEGGISYNVGDNGVIEGFQAEAGQTYKIWYFVQKPTAKKVEIGSLINPKTVRFTAQIAVYSSKGIGAKVASANRVGWLYYVVPYLKLGGNASVTGDQNNADMTKISGTAMSFDNPKIDASCSSCLSAPLAYMIFVPEYGSEFIRGIAVPGGVISVVAGEPVQIPVYLVMIDGSILPPTNYRDGFTYTVAPSGQDFIEVSDTGELYASGAGETEVLITYTDPDETEYYCIISISAEPSESSSCIVGVGAVGYMIVA